LVKQIFINGDDSIGILYVVSSNPHLTYDGITAIYRKRWNVEPYHKSLKQNTSLSQSPIKTVRTQSNHFALKSKLYLGALRTAFDTLRQFQPIQLAA